MGPADGEGGDKDLRPPKKKKKDTYHEVIKFIYLVLTSLQWPPWLSLRLRSIVYTRQVAMSTHQALSPSFLTRPFPQSQSQTLSRQSCEQPHSARQASSLVLPTWLLCSLLLLQSRSMEQVDSSPCHGLTSLPLHNHLPHLTNRMLSSPSTMLVWRRNNGPHLYVLRPC